MTEVPNKPPEASTSSANRSEIETEETLEQNRIVEVMDDTDSNVLRQRRLAFYDQTNGKWRSLCYYLQPFIYRN